METKDYDVLKENLTSPPQLTQVLRLKIILAFTLISLAFCTNGFGQLSSYINNMQLGTNYYTLKENAENYIDSLSIVLDSASFYSGAGDYKQFKKFKQLWEPRLTPHGQFESYYQAQDNFYSQLSGNFEYVTNETWHDLGPNKLQSSASKGIGPVEFISFFDNGTAQSTQFMLTGSLLGGLFYSKDSANTWESTGTDFWSQSGCGWAVFHPTDHRVWYASSSGNDKGGQSLWIGNRGGIYRTTNEGQSWTQIADKSDFDNDYYTIIYKLIIDPNDSNILYAATSRGLYKTIDCESSNPIWVQKLSGLTYDIELKPGNSNVIYSATFVIENGITGHWKILKSIDQGEHFNALLNQPDVLSIKDVVYNYFTIEVSKAKPDFLYCTSRKLSSVTYKNYLYYYDFSGNNTWVYIGTFNNGGFGGGHGFGVDQVSNGESIIVSDNKYMRKFNLNGTNNLINSYIHCDIEDVIYHPYRQGEVWTCTHGGVEKSINDGQIWQARYEGLGVAMVEQMATSKTNPELILLGLYHDGVQLTQSDYNNNWTPSWSWLPYLYIDGMMPIIDHKNPQNMFGSGQHGLWMHSSDGFQNATDISTGITYWETRGVLNKNNPDILYRNKIRTVSCEDVVRSSNMNSGQYDINDFISNFKLAIPTANYINILGLKTSFSNQNYLIVSLCTKVDPDDKLEVAVFHIFRTTNANAAASAVTWQELTIPRTTWISGIEFDQDNPNIIYLSYSNSSNNNNAQQIIYRIDYTNPASPVTVDMTYNLPVTYSYDNSIATQKGSNGGIYFATEFGIFYTNNDMSNENSNKWKFVGQGLPHVIPHGLELNYVSNTLRVGTYGRGVWEIPLPCINNVEPLLITQNTTWDSYMRLDRSVKVGYMSTLTISENARIAMPAEAKIIVEPGGKLIVNGGTITSGCDYPWQGIEIWGNSAQNQWPNSNGVYMQGYVKLNNAIIENAYEALNLWKPGDYTKTGGIVIANNTIFRNNRESVHALLYTNHHPVNGKPMDYQAIFTNCTFDITETYNPVYSFYKHVDLNQVNGVRFIGCDFNLSPKAKGISYYNMAIAAYSSGFSVNAVCKSLISPCEDYDKCTFSGFRTAIYSGNGSLNPNTFYVNRAVFNNNSIGIDVNGVWNPIIINSNFYLNNNQFSTEPCSYGIYLEKSTGFAIEENKFFKADGAPLADYFGIGSINCETVSEIYKNEFTGLSAGNYAYGKNFQDITAVKGLTYLCNKNTGNWADFYITGNLLDDDIGIQFWQGSPTQSAGNTFSRDGANWHIYNERVNPINYHYCTTCPNETPEEIGFVSLIPVNTANPCPSHYGGHSGKDVVMNTQQKLEREVEFAVASLNYDNVEILFNQLKDGGSTIEKEIEINTSTSDDMWSLRAELLGDSPHLSKEVLKLVADKTDVFTESVIFDILAANPDELRGEELLKYVAEKEIPLPEYMIDILRQIAIGTTYKTVLLQEMARYSHDRTRSANDIIRSILNEDELDVIQLRNWLSNLGGIESDKQIIATYLQEGNFSDALALANTFPQMYNLQQNDLTEHSRYMSLLQLEQTLFNEGRKLDQLTQSDLNMLNEYALASEGSAGAQARGILESFYGADFNDCKSLNGEESYKNTIVNPNLLGEAYGLSISVKPNPASDWAAIDYTLPLQESVAVLDITDANGKSIETINLSGNQGQKLWDTRDVPSGSYIITIKVAGFLKSVKLIVSK